MTPQDLRERILTLDAFEPVLAELKAADARNGGNIETALRACVREVHQQLAAQDLATEKGREIAHHLLYRQAIDLNAHGVPYLNYERELATRGGELWHFALKMPEQFFMWVIDELDRYFEAKTTAIIQEVDVQAAWYSGLIDAGKKSGELVNVGARLLKRGAEYLGGVEVVRDMPEEAIDTRDIVQRAIAKHLPPEVFGADLERIFEETSRRYVTAWTEKIRSETPNLAELKTFVVDSGDATDGGMFELGPAEQTLALGVGGAVLGTLSLAAGWHTLAYAMVHVFYPAAMVVAIGAAGVAWLRKEKDQENRRQRIRKTVNQYYRHCLLEIETGKRAELGGKTLRQALNLQATTTVQNALASWQRAISGNLTRPAPGRALASARTSSTARKRSSPSPPLFTSARAATPSASRS